MHFCAVEKSQNNNNVVIYSHNNNLFGIFINDIQIYQ